ncbi:MAG: mycofactocin system FadH/OYE family oxidoreductase 1 [Ilumatobacteraceae bacterium]
MQLLEPLTLGGRTAPNRILFGPHVTNLGDDDRRFTARHVAYYERRARGGCGTIVVEGASVHGSDWPYERAPLAERSGDGWASIVDACRPHGALVMASLDHAGGQGSSAYSQAPLWAPSRVPEVASREVPKWMEEHDIAAVVDGFEHAARIARDAGCDGVEVNAGQHSLVRQFLSGLTNQRADAWGTDRLTFARAVLDAVRRGAGPDLVVGLRLSCDELAPWAGITPEMAPTIAADLVGCGVDHVVVVRGSIFSVEQTRPDFHQPPGFNTDLAAIVAAAVDVPVVLQGSVVDIGHAEWAVGGYDDPAKVAAVEMTRAQIADPDLVTKLAEGAADRIRPCTRCNQTCQVRDARNPIVTCIGEPTSGRETEDPDWYRPTAHPRDVTVVGAGPAGLEAARVAAIRGHRVVVVEQAATVGGLAAVAGPNTPISEWLAGEVRRLGVDVRTGTTWPLDTTAGDLSSVVQCTGSKAGRREFEVTSDAPPVVDIADVRRGTATVPVDGDVVVFDPIGGPIAVALAEEIGARAVLVTQDNIAGNELARTGDLAPANTRLAQAGGRVERRSLLVRVDADGVTLRDRYSGLDRVVPCAAVVDCGFRLPTEPLPGAAAQAGDCVAPRTVHEAVLEARRVALAL